MSVKAFQQKVGATADGLFGTQTMKKAMEKYGWSAERAAHFFAQTAHETGNYKAFSENLNYSADGLNKIFPKYFKNAGRDANAYARNPEKIANVVYASRMGNGDEASGDGWKYRGRGALQLTGKGNYVAFSQYLGDKSVLENPDSVANEFAFESAMFFFDKNKLWDICDKGVTKETILALTKRINGGTHGLEDREKKTFDFYAKLK
jgi:putative chitinase